MSGCSTKKVLYNDIWDVGKSDSKKEEYFAQYFGTSDVIEFYRGSKCIAEFSKGEAWLFMNAIANIFEMDDCSLSYNSNKNPFQDAC